MLPALLENRECGGTETAGERRVRGGGGGGGGNGECRGTESAGGGGGGGGGDGECRGTESAGGMESAGEQSEGEWRTELALQRPPLRTMLSTKEQTICHRGVQVWPCKQTIMTG